MKITKSQLKQIIKEELKKLQEYGGRPYDPTVPGDFERARWNITGDAPPGPPLGHDPEDEPEAGPTGKAQEDKLEDEWFPPGLEEAVGIGTIALGTALGILGAYGGVLIGGKIRDLFKTIDRKLGKALARKARENARQVRGEARKEIRDLLANNARLEELVDEYHRLVLEVERIKGKRGPEYKAIRDRRKQVGDKLRKYVEERLPELPELVSPHLQGPARKVVRDPKTTKFAKQKR